MSKSLLKFPHRAISLRVKKRKRMSRIMEYLQCDGNDDDEEAAIVFVPGSESQNDDLGLHAQQ